MKHPQVYFLVLREKYWGLHKVENYFKIFIALEKVRDRENDANILIWYILRKTGLHSRKYSSLQKY